MRTIGHVPFLLVCFRGGFFPFFLVFFCSLLDSFFFFFNFLAPGVGDKVALTVVMVGSGVVINLMLELTERFGPLCGRNQGGKKPSSCSSAAAVKEGPKPLIGRAPVYELLGFCCSC